MRTHRHAHTQTCTRANTHTRKPSCTHAQTCKDIYNSFNCHVSRFICSQKAAFRRLGTGPLIINTCATFQLSMLLLVLSLLVDFWRPLLVCEVLCRTERGAVAGCCKMVPHWDDMDGWLYPTEVHVNSRVPTRGTFPARNLCGCGLERGSATQDYFERLRTSSSRGGAFLSRS